MPYPGVDCGPMTWTLVDQLDNPIDLTIFTPDVPSNTKSVAVYTEDSAKAASYPLRVKVVYVDHSENPGASKNFTVEITDFCETAYTITVPAAPLGVSYTVARPKLFVPPFDDFIFDPLYCPSKQLVMVTSPVFNSPDELTIQLDATTNTISVETSNI